MSREYKRNELKNQCFDLEDWAEFFKVNLGAEKNDTKLFNMRVYNKLYDMMHEPCKIWKFGNIRVANTHTLAYIPRN